MAGGDIGKWWNYLKDTVPDGKRLLTINLDETYVQYYQGLFTGNLAVTKNAWPVTQRPLTQPASRSQLRMGLTHVGILCDVPLAQRLLPQVIIASEKSIDNGCMESNDSFIAYLDVHHTHAFQVDHC